MMRPFRENFCRSRMGFEHEVVDDEKHSLLADAKNFHVGNTFLKFDTVDSSEQILVTTKTQNYPLWRSMDGTRASNQLEYKLCFAAMSRIDYLASKRCFNQGLNSTYRFIVVNRKNEKSERASSFLQV